MQKRSVKTCENCGAPLVRPYRRWCAKSECRKVADKEHRKQMIDDWRSNKKAKDKPKIKDHPERTCQYPPDGKKKYGRPLKGTANMFFYPEHARKIKWLIGIEEEEK